MNLSFPQRLAVTGILSVPILALAAVIGTTTSQYWIAVPFTALGFAASEIMLPASAADTFSVCLGIALDLLITWAYVLMVEELVRILVCSFRKSHA